MSVIHKKKESNSNNSTCSCHSKILNLTWNISILIKCMIVFVSSPHLRSKGQWLCTFSTGPGTCQEWRGSASARWHQPFPEAPGTSPSPCLHDRTDLRQHISDKPREATTPHLEHTHTHTDNSCWNCGMRVSFFLIYGVWHQALFSIMLKWLFSPADLCSVSSRSLWKACLAELIRPLRLSRLVQMTCRAQRCWDSQSRSRLRWPPVSSCGNRGQT